MSAYYNEFEPYAAQWLRNLIAAGLIPPGEVDERSIDEVSPDDLRGFTQVHLFAGLGGWAYAARLAGWRDDWPLWTGSCPCQPFSAAGKQKGKADKRHLWPEMHRLIAECRPATVAGEQVASRLGREWLAGVRADLEDLGYAVGAADLCAAGIGAPHIRQRLWWVAGAHGGQPRDGDLQSSRQHGFEPQDGQPDRLAEPARIRRARGVTGAQPQGPEADECGARGAGGGSDIDGLEHPPRHGRIKRGTEPSGRSATGGRLENFWSDYRIVPCADGKARRVGAGIQPLAHGIPARVGKLRAAGNAIVPQEGAKILTSLLHYRIFDA